MSIEIDALRKTYGATAAVDDLSIAVGEREFFAIVGASGCGKSTLLRLIAGLDVPDAGRIVLNGETVSAPDRHVPPESRNVGFVFQSYALWPHLDVLANVAFPIETAGVPARQAATQARRHLETVALTPLARRRPADLSGGQRQRVALARCLAQGAGTVLMDEPLANLDPHLRRAMETENLRAFHEQAGASTVYITHDQREAMAVADRMAVMAAGRFLQVGPPSEIYDRPASAEVARFIGEGAVVPVSLTEGGRASPAILCRCRGPPARTGPREAMLRPADLQVVPADREGALPARVQSALYRGGHWEVQAQAEGLPGTLALTLDRAVARGESLASGSRAAG